MSMNDPDGEPDDVSDVGEYAALHVEDVAMVIYDRGNHRAWVQSDLAVALDGMV